MFTHKGIVTAIACQYVFAISTDEDVVANVALRALANALPLP